MLTIVTRTQINVYELPTYTLMRSIPHSLELGSDYGRVSKDGTRVVFRINPELYRIVDTIDGSYLILETPAFREYCLSPNGTTVCLMNSNGLAFYSTQTLELVQSYQRQIRTGTPPVWSPDGHSVVFQDSDGMIIRLDVMSLTIMWSVNGLPDVLDPNAVADVTGMGFADDGTVIIGSTDTLVFTMDAFNGAQISCEDGDFRRVSVSPNNEYFARTHSDPTRSVSVFRLSDLKYHSSVYVDNEIVGFTFNPDSESLTVVTSKSVYRVELMKTTTVLNIPNPRAAGASNEGTILM
jgi:WD40 repeat protein